MFAAQGFIVVAPNYAGYDISTLGYHPFLNAAQQSGEMMDILAAARSGTSEDTSRLHLRQRQVVRYRLLRGRIRRDGDRASHADGGNADPDGCAPMSGPYALEAFGDAVFFGNVNLGSTVFVPLITTSYQHAYSNIYSPTPTSTRRRTQRESRRCCPTRCRSTICFPGKAAADRAVQQHHSHRDRPRKPDTFGRS